MGEFEPLAMLGTGMLGSVAGGKAAQLLGGGEEDPNVVNGVNPSATVSYMNSILQSALESATNTINIASKNAINQQNTSLGAATSALNNSLATGLAGSAAASASGNAMAKALSSPYANAGYAAIDSLQDLNGLSRPKMGAQAYTQAQVNAQNLSPLIQQLQAQGKAAGVDTFSANPNANAPTLQQAALMKAPDLATYQQMFAADPQLLQQYINSDPATQAAWKAANNPKAYASGGVAGWQTNINNVNAAALPVAAQQAMNSQQALYNKQQADQNAAYQTQYNNQMSLFNPYQSTYNQLNSTLGSMSDQQRQQMVAVASQNGLFSGIRN